MAATDDFAYHGVFRGDEASKRYHLPTNRDLRRTKCISLAAGDAAARTEELRQYFHNTFELYERVFEQLNSDESFYIQPVHKLRHPIIFYLGHTASFYMNKLCVAGLTTRINAKFEEMFAIGVDEMSWDDLNEAHYNWPAVQEVFQYRALVRDRVEELFRSKRFQLNLPLKFDESTLNDSNSFFWVINMGCEHERIHLETMSVHVRELPMRLVRPHSFWAPCKLTSEPPANELVPIPAGSGVRVGRPLDAPLYGWDCDYSQGTTHDVKAFKASKYLVSNKEFYQFVLDGGYTTQRYWTAEGWSWVTWKKPKHPWFWVERDGSFFLRTQVDEIPLPWDWPVETNQLEAKAFTNWLSEKTGKSIRLPTEGEWLLLHDLYVGKDQNEWNVAPGNLNLEHYTSSCPVTQFAQGPLFDVVGNAWQHTETPVYPYHGYKTHPFYDDFSMPTFDGRHTCMKGGAWISTGNESTRDARYAFRRHFFQYIGIRYVEADPVNECERMKCVLGIDPDVDASADFAYFEGVDGLQNFPKRLAAYANAAFKEHHKSHTAKPRAIDLYCGAGRVTFELASTFSEVLGIDWSARQLQPAYAMKERGVVQYSVAVPWKSSREPLENKVSQFTFGDYRDRVTFYQSDPTNLHAHITGFDLAVVWNVLERVYKPSAVIPHLLTRLNPGAIIVVASTYSWSQDYAHRDTWPWGKSDDDIPNSTVSQLEIMFGGCAVLVSAPVDMVAFLRSTNRTGDMKVFQVSTWRKN